MHYSRRRDSLQKNIRNNTNDHWKTKKPDLIEIGLFLHGCLTMSYFHTGNPYYHRR